MLKTFMLASLAVGTVVVPAQAHGALYDCGLRVVQHHVATGQNYEGEGFGYVVHPVDIGATVRCSVRVNGVEASSTPTGPVVAGRLTFSANDTDVVTLVAEVCTSHGCIEDTYETVRQELPPQEVNDFAAVKVIHDLT